jgi:hypothetical protein
MFLVNFNYGECVMEEFEELPPPSEVFYFSDVNEMLYTLNETGNQNCNTYFDPTRGWVAEKLVD